MAECRVCGALAEQGASACAECGAAISGQTESFDPVSALSAEDLALGGPIEGPVLVVRKGPEAGERFYIDRPRLTVGRDPESDIFLNDMTVSRSHAFLELQDAEVTVRDAASLNGTYVNGVCVDVATLSDGDVLQIGTFQMVFLRGGAA